MRGCAIARAGARGSSGAILARYGKAAKFLRQAQNVSAVLKLIEIVVRLNLAVDVPAF